MNEHFSPALLSARRRIRVQIQGEMSGLEATERRLFSTWLAEHTCELARELNNDVAVLTPGEAAGDVEDGPPDYEDYR